MGRRFRIFFPDLAASAYSGIHLSPGTTKFLIAAKLPIAPVGTGSCPVLGAGPVCSGGSQPKPDLHHIKVPTVKLSFEGFLRSILGQTA